jgi:hypothetical protein
MVDGGGANGNVIISQAYNVDISEKASIFNIRDAKGD